MTAKDEVDDPPRDSQIVVSSTKPPEEQRRKRLLAYDPQRLIRRAFVEYREPGSIGVERPFVEVGRLSILGDAFWKGYMWNYFPHIRSLDAFHALCELIQKRASVSCLARPGFFEAEIIRDCRNGKFQRDEKNRQRIVEDIAPFCDDLEGQIRRQVLKGKTPHVRQAAKERLWSFCAEPDEETALVGLLGEEAVLNLAERFETYALPRKKRSLRYWLKGGLLSPEARLLASELRFTFLSNLSHKGERCFEGHPAFQVKDACAGEKGDEEDDEAQAAA